MRRSFVFVLIVVSLVFVFTSIISAQTVQYRARIGNYTEGIAYLPNGTYANYIAMLDGYEVWAMPVDGKKVSALKLFDTQDMTINRQFVGMGYVPTEKLFVFTDTAQPDRLVFADQRGKSFSRTLVFPADDPFRPTRFEGVAYIPQDSANYPDHLIVVSMCQGNSGPCVDYPYEVRFLIVQRNGLVVKEIIPNFSQEYYDNYGDVWGVGYQASNMLWFTAGPYMWRMDFDGNMQTGLMYTGNPWDAMEGIAQLANGKIVVSNGFGKLHFFDSAANPLPALDRDYTIGLGIANPNAVAWNTDTNQLLIVEQGNAPAIWSLTSTLNTKNKVVPLDSLDIGGWVQWPEWPYFIPQFTRSLTYLNDEHLIALGYTNQGVPAYYDGWGNLISPAVPSRMRVMRFNNSGALVGYQRMFDWSSFPAAIWVGTFSSTSSADYGAPEFIFRNLNPTLTLHMVNPYSGTPDNMIDLSRLGLTTAGVTEYFKPPKATEGQFLILGNDHIAVVSDMNGNKISQFNYLDKLHLRNITDLAYITSGPYAGSFAAISLNNSELVIFRLK